MLSKFLYCCVKPMMVYFLMFGPTLKSGLTWVLHMSVHSVIANTNVRNAEDQN